MTKIADPKPVSPLRDDDAGEWPRNHNRPSRADDAVREFNDSLNQREGFVARITALADSAGRAEAIDEETAGRCTDLVRQIKAAAKVVEGDRDLTMRPYLDATRAVNEAAARHATKLDEAARLVTSKLNAYLTTVREAEEKARREAEAVRRAAIAEQERLDRERAAREAAAAARARIAEEERLAAIEANRPTPAPEPEPEPEPMPEPEAVYIPPPPKSAPVRSQARGDLGGLAAQRQQWKVRVQKWDVAFKAVQTNENVRAAVQKALDGLARGGVREIKGCEVYPDHSVMIR